MSKTILLISLAGTFLFACKSNKDTASTVDSTTTVQTKTPEAKSEASVDTPGTKQVTSTTVKVDSTKDDLYRLSVVFFSIGSGTDNKSMTAFEDFIGEYSGKTGKNIDYERTPWGREGETDYCLRLNELDEKAQADFVKQTTETLKDAKWVHIYENQPCKHKRNR